MSWRIDAQRRGRRVRIACKAAWPKTLNKARIGTTANMSNVPRRSHIWPERPLSRRCRSRSMPIGGSCAALRTPSSKITSAGRYYPPDAPRERGPRVHACID